jgi:hypothetical protein
MPIKKETIGKIEKVYSRTFYIYRCEGNIYFFTLLFL